LAKPPFSNVPHLGPDLKRFSYCFFIKDEEADTPSGFLCAAESLLVGWSVNPST